MIYMKTILIVNVNKQYEDIAEIFCELLIANWRDCPYEIFFCTDKELDIHCPGKLVICDRKSSLPNNILTVMRKENADCAICLLGDAFITDKVNTKEIEKLLLLVKKNEIQYCNLSSFKYKKSTIMLEKIKKNYPYPFGFIAFVVSRDFVENEFDENITDYDLELKYVKIAEKCTSNEKYDNMVRVNKNILHIEHGISKGKWFRRVKKHIDRVSQTSRMNKRRKLSVMTEIRYGIQGVIGNHISASTKQKMKKIARRMGMKFSIQD